MFASDKKVTTKRIRRDAKKEPDYSETYRDLDVFADNSLRFLKEGTYTDVTLVVGEEKEEIKAHKFVLASRSDVFEAMFSGNFKENDGRVEIPDIQPDILTTLLRYMYTSRFENPTDGTVVSLRYAGEKYGVSGFVSCCDNYLYQNITLENFYTVLNMATLFNERRIIEECLYRASVQGTIIVESDDFVSLSIEALQILLSYDHLEASEEAIFKACIRWGENQCEKNKIDKTPDNIRKCLGTTLHLVRIMTMKVETFSMEISMENILTTEEKLAFFQSLVNESDTYKKFDFTNEEPRDPAKRMYCVKFISALQMDGNEDFVEIMFNEEIVLVAIDYIIPEREEGSPEKYYGSFELSIRDEREEVIHSQTEEVGQYAEPQNLERVVLRPCPRLYRNRKYLVSLHFDDDYVVLRGKEGCGKTVTSGELELSLQKCTTIDRRTLQVKAFDKSLTCFHTFHALED